MKNPILAAAIALSAATSADAALLDFRYTFPETGSHIEGVLTGTVVGTTFQISGVQTLIANGVAQPSAVTVISADSLLAGLANPPAISLDNSFIDFLIADEFHTQIVGFAVNDVAANSFGAPLAGGSALFGGPSTFVFFHPENFSSGLEGEPGVPEPASWMMIVSGFGLIGAGLRCRSRIAIRFA